ncbi:unnamed protein product [Dibothriocephalus latus]|uniref:Uncharacterized protein n=1 Tax=Dibothriocephalus latus TaxID=60516 RepID=A0A3P6SZQ9_DIBLA|nr:unnamed protein product [Dibothriocephalus latus]
MVRKLVNADYLYWMDVVQDANPSAESVQDLTDIGGKLRQVKLDVDQILRNITSADQQSSDAGSTNQPLNSGPYDPEKIGKDLLNSNITKLANLNVSYTDRDRLNAVLDRYQSRLTDQNSGPNINGSAGDHSIISQSQAGKANDTVLKQQSSLVDHAGNIRQGVSSATGCHEHTTYARDGQSKIEYDDVLSRYRSRLPAQSTESQINASAGDNSVVSQSHVNKAHDTFVAPTLALHQHVRYIDHSICWVVCLSRVHDLNSL